MISTKRLRTSLFLPDAYKRVYSTEQLSLFCGRPSIGRIMPPAICLYVRPSVHMLSVRYVLLTRKHKDAEKNCRERFQCVSNRWGNVRFEKSKITITAVVEIEKIAVSHRYHANTTLHLHILVEFQAICWHIVDSETVICNVRQGFWNIL